MTKRRRPVKGRDPETPRTTTLGGFGSGRWPWRKKAREEKRQGKAVAIARKRRATGSELRAPGREIKLARWGGVGSSRSSRGAIVGADGWRGWARLKPYKPARQRNSRRAGERAEVGEAGWRSWRHWRRVGRMEDEEGVWRDTGEGETETGRGRGRGKERGRK
ncbi:hypothetical protein BO71DRAFT_212629 [Aspergillus ellipticus CBS 707.79]|uniref:Uncharacterized protein n=1 Tax=Aspergillus ellipticus CBS 707.79 TaxID=1448320 RepID=A0A319DLX1_9EURO|nr:hypothetical protein BO71DRAFT_212629 [Aspergillus ellipticus CBS 707.79]